MTHLLAHIQLCLIDSCTIVKQLFATVSFLMKGAVLIVIFSLLSNVCTLLKNLRLHTSCYCRINELHGLFTQNWHYVKWLHAKRGSWLIIGYRLKARESKSPASRVFWESILILDRKSFTPLRVMIVAVLNHFNEDIIVVVLLYFYNECLGYWTGFHVELG